MTTAGSEESMYLLPETMSGYVSRSRSPTATTLIASRWLNGSVGRTRVAVSGWSKFTLGYKTLSSPYASAEKKELGSFLLK